MKQKNGYKKKKKKFKKQNKYLNKIGIIFKTQAFYYIGFIKNKKRHLIYIENIK